MSDLYLKTGFKLSTLALSVSLALLSPASFALEALDDEGLSGSTGEGIAFLPENFSMQFNGADDKAGAGYIRLIPVGPLSTQAQAAGFKKADIYLYGMSLSQSNKNYGDARTSADWGSAFGKIIDSWGTADNPWLINVKSKTVPNFAGVDGVVSYLTFEAPLYNKTLPAAGSKESSAYNLKLNLWLDAFMRDETIAEVQNSSVGLNNRLRLNVAWDGFGINGSNLQVFRTLDGVTAANASAQKLSTSYNNTLGIAGLVRLNSGDTTNLKANVSFGTPTFSTPDNPATPAANAVTVTYNPRNESGFANNICGSSTNNTGKAGANNPGQCMTQEGYIKLPYTASGTNSWTPPSTPSVLRISTQEIGSAFDSSTPALGGALPSFNASSATNTTDGIYLYGLNVNMVLGTLLQPLIFNSADGSNFSLELTRIPNNPAVYKQIYTAYADALNGQTASDYKGSTCNIYKCGTEVNLGGTTYQGSSATHSSISIGTTNYDATTNSLTAYNGIEAVGISFGEMQAATGLTSTASQDYIQVYQRTRTCTTDWLGACDGGWNAYGNWSKKSATDFAQNSGPGPTGTNPQILRLTSNVPASNPLTVPGKSIGNNFGSAVIDGLLINHMKITTTGLEN